MDKKNELSSTLREILTSMTHDLFNLQLTRPFINETNIPISKIDHLRIRLAQFKQIFMIYESEVTQLIDSKRNVILKSTPTTKKVEGDLKKIVINENIQDDSLKSLSEDLNSMLEKNKFTDVNINCGEETFKAHKIILCSRSSVFEAMLTIPMQERNVDNIVIDDITPEILRVLLTYLYNGRVPDLDVSTASSLLYAAEKYHVGELKKICIQYLISNLSLENVFEILNLGHLYDDHLKENAIFLIQEEFGTLRKTEAWKVFEENNARLALEIYHNVCNRFYSDE